MSLHKSQKRVTLVDVAKDAEVSPSTVSLVLRESPLVAAKTKQRVEASIHKLGYIYNRAAASMRSQSSNTVGVVITNIKNAFFAEFTAGIEQRLEQDNIAMLLANTGDHADKQRRLLQTMHEHHVDGLLFVPAYTTPSSTLKTLQSWRLPFVLAMHHLGHDSDNGRGNSAGCDYVGPDNVHGAHLATTFLMDKGHTRIAFVGGAGRSSTRKERFSGYRQALTERGLTLDARLVIESEASRKGGYQAMQHLLSTQTPPTAALCYNDVVAFGAMLGLQQRGQQPGKDVAIVGYDNIDEAQLSVPSLTTVAIRPQYLGEASATMLLERLRNPDMPPRMLTFKPELMVRDSSGM